MFNKGDLVTASSFGHTLTVQYVRGPMAICTYSHDGRVVSDTQWPLNTLTLVRAAATQAP
jgi:hypothetical protein